LFQFFFHRRNSNERDTNTWRRKQTREGGEWNKEMGAEGAKENRFIFAFVDTLGVGYFRCSLIND